MEPCGLVPVKALPPAEVLEQLREEEELLRESGLPDAAPGSCDQRTATFPSPSENSQQLQALARNRTFRWGACPDHPRCSLQPHLSESETSALYGELRLRCSKFWKLDLRFRRTCWFWRPVPADRMSEIPADMQAKYATVGMSLARSARRHR